jgi:hypothetical protein
MLTKGIGAVQSRNLEHLNNKKSPDRNQTATAGHIFNKLALSPHPISPSKVNYPAATSGVSTACNPY